MSVCLCVSVIGSTFTVKLCSPDLMPDPTINYTIGALQAGCCITGCVDPQMYVKLGVPSAIVVCLVGVFLEELRK